MQELRSKYVVSFTSAMHRRLYLESKMLHWSVYSAATKRSHPHLLVLDDSSRNIYAYVL